jgi:hypothetical protein
MSDADWRSVGDCVWVLTISDEFGLHGKRNHSVKHVVLGRQ